METSLPNVQPFKSPAWYFNGNAHTVGRTLLSHPRKPPCRQMEIPTPDGDFLELDVIDANNGRPAIAVFHGLEGSTNGYYIIELMRHFSRMNYGVVAVNFRSCGSKMNRRRRFYHSGETGDMHTVFAWMQEQFPQSPLGAAGFSLGGNMLLKSLGEKGRNHPLTAAVAVSVPYDLKTGSLEINRGFNKVYQYHFLKSLTAKLKRKRQKFADLPTFDGSTMYAFDNQVTAPVHGFNNADEYYSMCSSNQFVNSIERPTLLVHSKEDPICPAADMPMRDIKNKTNLDYLITPRGGHVGFMDKEKSWLNTVITSYFKEQLNTHMNM